MVLLKRIVKEYLEEKLLSEGFNDDVNPDSKYYAFDWDDNIVHMPTKIMVRTENGEEIRRFHGPKSYEQVLEFIK